jgi:NAD dependent epimerase/dehydratase
MSKILVTGADGFIGSHLTEALVRSGHQVRAFTLYNSASSSGWLDYCANDVADDFEIFPGDIRDPDVVRLAMRGQDVVMHLAALIAIPYSYRSPRSYVDTNITGTLNVLQAARENEVGRVIHTSTSEVYGSAKYVPMTEDHPLSAQSPYSASKIGADQLAMSFHKTFSTPIVIIRPFNTYGPRQSLRAVIPSVITQLLSGSRVLSLGALSPTRDFSFVSDTTSGFIAAMDCVEAIGETINLGSSFEISIEDTAKTIGRLMNIDVEFKRDTDRLRPVNSEVTRLLSAVGKAERLLNWRPNYAGLQGFENGLALTIKWFSENDNLAHYGLVSYRI